MDESDEADPKCKSFFLPKCFSLFITSIVMLREGAQITQLTREGQVLHRLEADRGHQRIPGK